MYLLWLEDLLAQRFRTSHLYSRPGRFIPVSGNVITEPAEGDVIAVDVDVNDILGPCPCDWCGTGNAQTVSFTSAGDPDKFPERGIVQTIDFFRSDYGAIAPTNITPADFHAMLERIYAEGGSPDVVYFIPENAYDRGLINWWELQWLLLKRWVGRLKRSVISGVRSVRRTSGVAEPTVTPSGTSSSEHGEPSSSSSLTPPSPSGSTSPSTTPTPSGTKDTSSRGTSAP